MVLVSAVSLNILQVIFDVALIADNLKHTLFADKQCFSYCKLSGNRIVVEKNLTEYKVR